MNYDGLQSVVHTVSAGESLSSIAAKYKFAHGYKPIFKYNHFYMKTIGKDENLIHPGDKIFIPRSPEGYQKLCEKLRLLLVEIAVATERIKGEIEADKAYLDAKMVVIDFAGDVATMIAGFGFKALEAAKLAKFAKAAEGSERIAAEYLAKKAAKNLAESIESKAKDSALGFLAQDNQGAQFTLKAGKLTKDIPEKGGKILTALERFQLGQIGRATLGLSEVLISFLKPSWLARNLVGLATGENVVGNWKNLTDGTNWTDGTVTKVAEKADKQRDQMQAHLRMRIAANKAECAVLYSAYGK